jgi:hypothetical protein
MKCRFCASCMALSSGPRDRSDVLRDRRTRHPPDTVLEGANLTSSGRRLVSSIHRAAVIHLDTLNESCHHLRVILPS